jgi:hypothetical protein
MNTLGTSLDEAFSINQQIDPKFMLENTTMHSKNDIYDPQEMIKLSQKVDSPALKNIQNTESSSFLNLPPISSNNQAPNSQNSSNSSNAPIAPIQTQIKQSVPMQTELLPITNPVQQYHPYEYDANALQKQLQEQNDERKLEELKKIKDIKQYTRNKGKKEHFLETSDGKKKGDLSKSIIFSLLILLPIAFHSFISFVFEHFVSAPGEYSLRQEVGMRLIYPILILIVIWFAKL